jgi:uncharacterized protein
MSQPADATKGRTGWIISDGKAGNDVQSKGVFDALGLDVTVKKVEPRGLHKGMSPWIGVAQRERFGEPGTAFAPPHPDFAISIGRLTTPYLRALKRLAGDKTFAIILQDPKVPLKTADLFWVPEHDALRGPNVITTLTAPHSFTDRRLKTLRATMPADIAVLPRPRVAVLLGGSNGDYTYTTAALARLGEAIRALTASDAGLMITPSRRTEPAIIEAARAAAAGSPRIVWDMTGENPYPQFLAHADAFVVPADSVNMTGEPCATGKPVYVFYPDGGSAKFRRYHEALEQWGATRPFSAATDVRESWAYRPLNSADIIAAEVVRHWQQRQASKS